MLQIRRILVSAISHAALAVIVGVTLLGLIGCGQTGALYLPAEPAAANRATLPQSLWPVMPDKKTDTPPNPAPAPVPAPDPANAPPAQ